VLEALDETGVDLEVLTGNDEARLNSAGGAGSAGRPAA
jgi:exopolyphosphatase/pppGpp-phosphohydrolase